MKVRNLVASPGFASVVAVGLVATLAACGSSADSNSGTDAASATSGTVAASAPPSEPAASDESSAANSIQPPTPPAGVAEFETVEPGSGDGITVGFTQLALSSGFPQDVQKGMDEQARIAGLNLITCDSQLDAAKALDCAKNFKTQGAQGLITFQADTNASPRICDAGPQVPVIAVDIEQKPCQTSFMGAANEYAGELAGYAVGKYFAENENCEYDAFISLEALQVGAVNEARMGGIRKEFESICGPIGDRLHKLDTGGAGGEVAQKLVTDTLTALPDAHKVIVVGINEDGILGALAAARATGRSDDLYLGVQNFNPTNCTIYQAPHWLGSVAYFPERYAEILIPNIIRAVKGESVPAELLVPHELITADNILDYYPEYSC